jgi:hypothetical protein
MSSAAQLLVCLAAVNRRLPLAWVLQVKHVGLLYAFWLGPKGVTLIHRSSRMRNGTARVFSESWADSRLLRIQS